MKVIIGAGKTAYEGWISTQENELDLLNRADFERMFAEEKPSAFLAEHVWEHMTFDDGCTAAQNCYEFLADGGYIRVAVPDANFRSGIKALSKLVVMDTPIILQCKSDR